MKDHLGNVRLSFKPASSSPNITQEDFYYPFGLRISRLVNGDGIKYLYNGKEMEDKYDLYWYHYGAREYDPMIARWLSMDPADEFHSPYCYVGNDPVNLIDPDGRQAFPNLTTELKNELSGAWNYLTLGGLWKDTKQTFSSLGNKTLENGPTILDHIALASYSLDKTGTIANWLGGISVAWNLSLGKKQDAAVGATLTGLNLPVKNPKISFGLQTLSVIYDYTGVDLINNGFTNGPHGIGNIDYKMERKIMFQNQIEVRTKDGQVRTVVISPWDGVQF